MGTIKIIVTALILSFSINAIPAHMTNSDWSIVDNKRIQKMIETVEPSFEAQEVKKIADLIQYTSRRYNIDPKIIVSIIDTESDFRHHKVSSTGDISLVQINPKVWKEEFKRLGLGELDIQELKRSERYALIKMGQILVDLKTKYAHKDEIWYARYHSKTKSLKKTYANKLDLRMRKIASI
ncbi:MAG: transglycosylase SLT domain-containing protein [Bacteriovoracaceae bacterium]|jgi:soluble lytic murein transglycosylase|nr:transglycosylase SLT domain-containing protein [Bacteriovoracaceae bacterium]